MLSFILWTFVAMIILKGIIQNFKSVACALLKVILFFSTLGMIKDLDFTTDQTLYTIFVIWTAAMAYLIFPAIYWTIRGE